MLRETCDFKVVYVKDAITYYARLIRHRGVDGVLHQVPSNKFNLDLSLQTYFSQAYAKIPIDPATIEPDRLCVYGKAGVYCRARVVHVLSNSSSLFPSTARVHLLDECAFLILESFPPELVEIVACKLKPMDHDIEWSSEVTTYISQLLLNEIVCGKIRLCLGNTLWCDPIVKREYLKESKIWVSLWYVNLKLLGDVSVGNLATENPKHIELLRDACKGKVVLPAAPSKTDKVSKQNQLIPDSAETIAAADAVAAETRQLDEFESCHIYFSNVEDPSEMFIIRTDQYDRIG
ncbi:TDRD12 [Bugula neritina]|uniref:RNA helicase n=1 Tax=Bugula neritina TaxID=10212 RepID=A0A7J7JVX8_BUGNE|nr:TDRD12 [Bugula neritina]